MGFVKKRKIKCERKKAHKAAQRLEARVWQNNGYSCKEISEIMGIKESTIRKLLKEN